MNSKQFVRQESKELLENLKKIRAQYRSGKITRTNYLKGYIFAYREFYQQINNHIG